MENWKTIPFLKGYYAASDLGRIKRLTPARGARVGRILKPIVVNGYLNAHISIDRRARLYGIHRLVAAAWIGGCPHKLEVHHKDDNKKTTSRRI